MSFQKAVIILVIIILVWKYVICRTRVELHYADWCPHCQTMKPIWEAVKKDLGYSVNMVEIDGDKKQDPLINGFPTIVLLKGGERLIYSGGPNYASLKSWISSNS